MIRTPLTELLGIRYPVVQAAMGYVSGPRLAAGVRDRRGLGLIRTRLDPEGARDRELA